jgi:hypothetical protein
MIRIVAATLVIVASLLVAGCGGGGGERSGSEAMPKKLPPKVVANANSNCRYLLRNTQQIGKRALIDLASVNLLELTTERFVKPSIPLLERVADRQQALESGAHNPQFSLYADLFDPIIAIAHERLATGRAGDPVRSKGLEELLTSLGVEQMQAARSAGLRDCDVDFQRVLLSSLNH